MHMPKTSEKYFTVDPWMISEVGFNPKRARLSESIFAVANEFMCVRGYFEEGYSGDCLLGSYFSQLYDYLDFKYPQTFKGFVNEGAAMLNAVDWLYTRIELDGELLDLAKVQFSEFRREIDMRNATLKREFIWRTKSGKELKLIFSRFANAAETAMGCQRITFKPLNFSGSINIVSGLDFNTIYEIAAGWDQTKGTGCIRKGDASQQEVGLTRIGDTSQQEASLLGPRNVPLNEEHPLLTEQVGGDLNFWTLEKLGLEDGIYAIQAKTRRSGMKLFSSFKIDCPENPVLKLLQREQDKFIGTEFSLKLIQGRDVFFDKIVVNHWEVSDDPEQVWVCGLKLAHLYSGETYDSAYIKHCRFWEDAWNRMDIEIDGDPEVQQGVRFSIFMTYMNYHGGDERRNVLCKLAGEVYNGVNFWDSEIYCHRMYMFINPKAARNLLMYRYHYLPKAMEDARRVDLEGARYPFATVSGVDDSGCWQHCDLEIHQNVAVFYAIWHYNKVCGDKEFLYNEGIEMLLQMSRCMASWGGWSPKRGDFGFYGVMGPDEFHMMVNNNCYTNVMSKKMFNYTLEVLEEMKRVVPELYENAVGKVGLKLEEQLEWKKMADNMRIPKDEETGIYEQHDGYFDLPHVDVANFPVSQIPVYKNWVYIKIFRHNMIKQPDFLNLPFFFSQDYTLEEKRVNYEFYEARTIHESSLSPSLHSILAAELGKFDDAYNFLAYASRLDLDNYNRNTEQGLHATASSGVWAGMVSGFGGMRTDGEILSFAPSIPEKWNSFSFKLLYLGSLLSVRIDKENAEFKVLKGHNISVKIYEKEHNIDSNGIKVSL